VVGEKRPVKAQATNSLCRLQLVTLFVAATLTCLEPGSAQEAERTPPERTLSRSQQFIIYGGTAQARMNVARRGEQLAERWTKATGIKERWRWPIIINLIPASRARWSKPETKLFIGDGDTVKVQIEAPDSLPRSSDLDLYFIQAMTLEAMYRRAELKAGRTYKHPPSWLVDGIWQETAGGNKLPPTLYEKLIEGGPPPSVKSFLKLRPEKMDPTSRSIYRAQAQALLTALVSTPEGYNGLHEYITRLPKARPNDPRPLLESFPTIESDRSQLAKLWTLSLARPSKARETGNLSARDTREQLEQILEEIKPLDPNTQTELKGSALLPELARDRRGRFRLARISESLERLETRAHPLYRPLIQEYRTVTSELSRKYRRDAARRLAATEELRQAIDVQTESVADHLNWFEAAKLSTPSEPLPDEYALPTMEERVIPHRRDRISSYIDQVEQRTQ